MTRQEYVSTSFNGIMNDKIDEWLSLYIYYTPPYRDFLVNCVDPFVKSLSKTNQILEYFFVLYNENGPHVRLRCKVNPSVSQKLLRDQFEDYFHGYLREFPSRNIELGDTKLQENNTLVWRSYEPEYSRYGGQKSIRLAEHNFQVSSDTVIRIMSNISDWNYGVALSMAVKMHVLFFKGSGLTINQILEFCRWSYESYLRYILTWPNYKHGQEKYEKLLALLQKSHEKHRTIIQPIAKIIVDSDTNFDEDWYLWYFEVSSLDRKFTSLFESKQLEFQSASGNPSFPVIFDDARYPMYSSLLHMTNNRLGIDNRDECLIPYLIYHSLSELLS